MMEKMASGLRFVMRAVQADLARFKTYVEMQDAKGIDYRPNPENEKDDGGDDGADADEPTSRDQKSDEERKQERKEREKAREERRTSGSSSS
jgi:hypothetical protein